MVHKIIITNTIALSLKDTVVLLEICIKILHVDAKNIGEIVVLARTYKGKSRNREGGKDRGKEK